MPGPCGYQLIQIDSATGEPMYDGSGQPLVDSSPASRFPAGAITGGFVDIVGGSLGSLIVLPVQSRIGVESGFERQDILFETELGRRYVFPQFIRQKRTMTFRLNPDQLLSFFYLDLVVGGQRDPFYFVADLDNAAITRFFCRKESSFIVKQVDGSQFGAIVDYQMSLTEEPTGLSISA
jgi:hypothetical protein